MDVESVTLPALKYLSGDTENICRLCFGPSEVGVSLYESRPVKGRFFEDTVTFEDMLKDLGATSDPSLPQVLCACCAESATNAFLFQKLCQLSINKWENALEELSSILNPTVTDALGQTVKTTYLIIQNERNLILTTRKLHHDKNKVEVLQNIQALIKARQKYKDKKKLCSVCEECGETFPSTRILKCHMRSHSTKKYPCTQCHKEIKSKSALVDHIERVHRPKNIQCPKCAQMFSTEKFLRYHDLKNHTAVVCKRCFVQFPSRKALHVHMNRHDINKCPHCSKEFVNKQTFKMHLKLCLNNRKQLNYFCDICQKGYNSKCGLRSHMITDHGFGRIYPCNWCKKPFDARSKLKSHIVKHTRERNFYCDQCGGQFVTHAALVYHIRIHTGEKPFSCDMCEESFLSASRRMEHRRRKHLGPDRVCGVCHRKFVTAHELAKHAARHKNPQSKLFVAENDKNNKSILKREIIYF